MMNKRSWFLVFGLVMLGLVSCDEIDDPYEHLDVFISDTGDIRFNDTTYNDSTLQTRGLIIEDFTGHQCPNCPVAQDESKKLVDDNPGVVWALAIHNSRSFSEFEPPEFPGDFETETGQKLLDYYQVPGFPAGVINRSEWNSSFVVGFQQWSNIINTQVQDQAYMAPRFKVRSTNIYNTESRVIRVIPKVESLVEASGDVFFIAVIAENGIISPQVDNRLPAPSIDDEYVHNHLLRVGFPQDGDGKLLFSNPRVGDTFQVLAEEEELRFKLPEEWRAENCELFYLVVRRTTELQEVMHVEVMPLYSAGG